MLADQIVALSRDIHDHPETGYTEFHAVAAVADLLHDEGLTLGQHDRINPGIETPLTPGLTVTLDRVSVEETTRTEELAFTTTKEDDSSLDKGDTRTVTKGVKGSKTIVEKKTTVNGTLESTEVGAPEQPKPG